MNINDVVGIGRKGDVRALRGLRGCLFLRAGEFWLLWLVLVGGVACSPKVIYQKETVVEYRDRIVHDTATVEIPKIVEKNVTTDTLSRLENRYAKSEAVVSKGLLFHSLESIPQIIKVPVEVHVTDTLWKEAEIRTEIKEVEKPLSWWKSFKLEAFWWLIGSIMILLVVLFRKQIFKI